MFSFRRKAARVVVRSISASAAQACAVLHAASFAHPWATAEFETLLAAENVASDGAYAGGDRLVGFALSRHAAGEAEVLSVAVTKSERGKGVGRDLMNAHLARLAAAGVTSVFLEVEPGNLSALALYRRLGFETVGERKDYYRKAGAPAASALTLRCNLG